MMNIVEKQRQFFASGATRGFAHRARQLLLLEQAIVKNQAMIAEALAKDLGKSEAEAIATEIGPTLEEIRYTRKKLRAWMQPKPVATPVYLQPGKSRIHREPLGVVLIIAPWNYPFFLTIAPLIGALAAGNCAVIKPSELSQATAVVLATLIGKTFAPEIAGVVNGGVAETTELLRQKFDHIFFTGSTAVGKIVMQAAAAQLTPVTLELGGKSPAIVGASADIELAARRIAWGKFTNAGQTCVAPDYVYVQESIQERFCGAFAGAVRDFFGSDPRTSASFGRIISARHFERLEELAAGKQNQLPLENDRASRYFAPTLLTGIRWQDKVMQEEIFGPILPVLSFRDFHGALSEIRLRDKPLAAYLFSEDAGERRAFVEELSFGGGCINDTLVHIGNPHLPFGGVGASGMGAYHGERSFLVFSHEKSVLVKSRLLDVAFRYPPYTAAKMKWLRRVFRL